MTSTDEAMADHVVPGGPAGGADGSKQAKIDVTPSLSIGEEHILRCLGAAVIDRWSDLPAHVQRLLFERATELGAPRHT